MNKDKLIAILKMLPDGATVHLQTVVTDYAVPLSTENMRISICDAGTPGESVVLTMTVITQPGGAA